MSGIYVGIDGSSHSQLALQWAMREAVIRREPLTVIAVHEVPTSGWGGMIVYPQDSELRAESRKAAQEAVDKAAAQLGGAAPSSVTVQASIGLPSAQLIEVSRDADLLVIGSRGAGGFTRLIVGSTSAQVSEHAHCPVVIVR
jgi:nucleotide-binding universal stress UspA family protein